MMRTTWRKLIDKARELARDNSAVEGCTLTQAELDVEFDDGYGGAEGEPFTMWTLFRVYFPVVYDGSEWVGSVPRNPCDEATVHQGDDWCQPPCRGRR